ncbi:MAG TPA: hypothetical protein VG709_03600, partial [Actinomycetota bacterium]|nr:hypothetical protein [Actinomycetota bacterium]
RRAGGVELFPLPAKLHRSCREAAEHAPILCPSVFPRRAVEPRSPPVAQQLPFDEGLYGLELGYSAPYENAPRRNRPDRFLHFVVIAQRGPAAYAVGAEPLERATIGERHGRLSFVTEFSVHYDHVVFEWREDGVRYQASLHAWDDRRATTALLRALVATLRPPPP